MKRLGACTLCDREVFEVIARHKEGEVAGWPARLGSPFPEARRATLLFASGTTGEVTLCGECQITPETLPQVHHQIRRLWAFEGTNGKREQLKGRTQSVAEQWRMGAWQLGAYDDIPLGQLCEERWSEAMEREARRG